MVLLPCQQINKLPMHDVQQRDGIDTMAIFKTDCLDIPRLINKQILGYFSAEFEVSTMITSDYL